MAYFRYGSFRPTVHQTWMVSITSPEVHQSGFYIWGGAVPTEYRSRVLGAWSIEGHMHRLWRMVRQVADGGESEPTTTFRSSRRRTRQVAWSDKPASGVPGLVRPPRAEGGERRCCPGPR